MHMKHISGLLMLDWWIQAYGRRVETISHNMGDDNRLVQSPDVDCSLYYALSRHE